ncbi:DUF202 domain-containing protein [Mycolicibacterium sphagni]|jgi:uncharacterized membrane protein YidH (DUF202 family)|uniref:DUF202 domain-containing protein n=1 Tax=Mycolicibacterium sphagni TaxID=1786 RepID=A0A255DMQ0_9MYCO|nr:DUF202 domain-containing protein [Mycolicibacterium sphagni]MCV7179901.1 DUF202 domain-containing protein [Mycolicibacterium sphagni]OYN80727.1 hypothetical protein CG716_07670 [Mycolicibacterium sphagni]
MDDPDSELLDPAGAAERTALAWQRTIIGTLLVGALIVRWSVTERVPPGPGVLVTLVSAMASLFLVGRRYQRVQETVRAGQTPLSRYLVPAATVFTVLVVLAVGAEILAEYSPS